MNITEEERQGKGYTTYRGKICSVNARLAFERGEKILRQVDGGTYRGKTFPYWTKEEVVRYYEDNTPLRVINKEDWIVCIKPTDAHHTGPTYTPHKFYTTRNIESMLKHDERTLSCYNLERKETQNNEKKKGE